MPGTDKQRALDKVYAATNDAELSEAYAEWAAAYDRETAELGYALPFLITSWVARYVAPADGSLLDAGCGTGLSGPYLRALGYASIEGLDLSDDMLAIARGRGAYRDLKQGVLGEKLPWDDGHFAAFLSTGVFTKGHAPASGLRDLVRITRPGGYAIFTVRDGILEEAGFRAVFAELESAGKWKPVEESPPFQAFAIAEPEAVTKAFVFRVT